MEQKPNQEPYIETSPKQYTAVPQDWQIMTEEQKDKWAEDFLVGLGLFLAPTKEQFKYQVLIIKRVKATIYSGKTLYSLPAIFYDSYRTLQ